MERIGWLNGKWDKPSNLFIPLNNRGLLYGDGIYETVLIYKGKVKLLSSHLKRWNNSAIILGMKKPPQEDVLIPLIKYAINTYLNNNESAALRLNWSRGNNFKRGINIDEENIEESHQFWLEINKIKPFFSSISTKINDHELRNASSQLSSHKTFGYSQSIQVLIDANKKGYDDALLKSSTGEICCGSTGNILVKRDNEILTPRLESGCLPGIMRSRGISSGLFKEAYINPIPLENDEWLLLNSLSCKSIYKINDDKLQTTLNARSIWESLLD